MGIFANFMEYNGTFLQILWIISRFYGERWDFLQVLWGLMGIHADFMECNWTFCRFYGL